MVLDGEVAVRKPCERVGQPVRGDLDEEAEPAVVDAEHRYRAFGDETQSAEHRPVATQRHDAVDAVDDMEWVEQEFLPGVGKRGAAVIEARGSSSAASAANAAIDHVRDWVVGSGDWVSMGVASDGSYEIPEGLICGFPCTCRDGRWEIVQGLDLGDFSRARIDASVQELIGERDTVAGQGLI